MNDGGVRRDGVDRRAEQPGGALSRKVVGQPDALRRIVPYIQMYQTRLNAPDRPAGVFLLLGPSGTGKTRTVEALAEILHGSASHLLKIDCAEYQSDHEVAKLIGAPPGYIGHRETKPLLTQERLLASVSPQCDLALVLFDEIEKAAPAFTSLLLGLLDRATLRLGDNTSVNFEKSLVFLTSNLGAREMGKVFQPDIGFHGPDRRSPERVGDRLQTIGVAAVRRRFSPEFVNRIDAVISYRPLDGDALGAIVDQHVEELRQHVNTRLADKSFGIGVTRAARQLLLDRGTSAEYGARELRRTVHRMLTQPLAALVAGGAVAPRSTVTVDVAADGASLSLRSDAAPAAAAASPRPVVLVLDENAQLAKWLDHVCGDAGVTGLTAANAAEARDIVARYRVDVAIVDLVLPDDDGLAVVRDLLGVAPHLSVVVTTGGELSPAEAAFCERHGFPVLRKPFLPEDVIALVRARVAKTSAAAG